jgi:LysR family transcriptional regulator (chromosome initiation inhibitor)
MLDYPLIEALAAVVREGSFEKAARVLHVTPSAVSQRVKLLEERIGKVLVVRSQPCAATAAGAALCRHADRVALFEHELRAQLPEIQQVEGETRRRPTVRIAANADSIATWLVSALAGFAVKHDVLFEVVVEDQDHTADFLRKGAVQGAVTTLAVPVQGCRSVRLGRMRFVASCSPSFHRRYFSEGVTRKTLGVAPCLVFNTKDAMQDVFMRKVTRADIDPPTHWLPSSQGFVEACLHGMGWGMNPEALVKTHMERGTLVEVVPGSALQVALYWQSWSLPSELLDDLTRSLVATGRSTLS